jgi:hypothetical protein
LACLGKLGAFSFCGWHKCISTVWGRTGRCCCIVQQQPEPATARRLIGSDMSAVCESALLYFTSNGEESSQTAVPSLSWQLDFFFFFLRRNLEAKKREEVFALVRVQGEATERRHKYLREKTAPSDQISPFLVVPSLSWQLIVALRIVVPAK